MGQTPTETRDSQSPDDLINEISPESFDQWYREREFRKNIEQGTPYFNGSSPPQPATRHSPSSLLKCHRKTYYQQYNAPEETSDPDGIFWIGSRFEEDIVVPFLREAVAGDTAYVTNSLWIDFSVSTAAGDLRIKGETDPVIVTGNCEPILLTEIKTKDSVEHTTGPNRHHRAQAHAYMKGLSEKYDRNVTEAVILYASRKTLDVKSFRVEFDPWFWSETVLGWAETNTTYRLNNEQPPDTPEYDWECEFCPFKERCGQGTLKFEDIGSKGLLPGFTEYPKPKLVEYLESHVDAKLTPSLAHEYPGLVAEYGAFDWKCRGCSETVAWNAVEWDSDTEHPPTCPTCSNQGPASRLVGPAPADQLVSEDDGR